MPPFSVAGKQLGQLDGRDLFPEALRLVAECNPKAVMLENVWGLFAPKFKEYCNSMHRIQRGRTAHQSSRLIQNCMDAILN